MRFNLVIILTFLASFSISKTTSNLLLTIDARAQHDLALFNPCDYIEHYKEYGNTLADTFRIGRILLDPIDDSTYFKKASFDFYMKGKNIFKKSNAAVYCDGKLIRVEYFQDFGKWIDLNSYRAYNDTYFTTRDEVYFWYVNSGGHVVIPINGADSKTFKPFENVCGGFDNKSIYYGCPNLGVYKLDIPKTSKFEFVPKKNSFWNSPNHYVKIGNNFFDIKYDINKGYYVDYENPISKSDILKTKK